MAVDLAANNSELLRAAYTAMDQTYTTVIQGDPLLSVDNAGLNRPQPFVVPSGYQH